jgi:undecaprenyl diphosphate synthase
MTTLIERIRAAGVPRHVALIMDGNGRWAAAKGLSRTAGHQAGAEAAERLVRFAGERLGLRYLTLYAFSTENWTRPEQEVDFLMDLLRQFIDDKLREFAEAGIRLRVAGDLDGVPARVRETVQRAIRETADGENMHVTVALNYGARREIVHACTRIAQDVASGRLTPDRVTEAEVADRLYTAGIPDPDLIVRTSGEMRLSNFLLWQAAYAELYFTSVLWPDFTPAELVRIIAAFQERDRRYGGRKEGEER